MKAKPVWKTNHQSQLSLPPPSYGDFIGVNHPVRVVNTILDKVDISAMERTYKGVVLLTIILVFYLRFF